ncbi:GNAT family N-acetyltransferase [Amorphoplanes nipponensis]|uniref:GNAT family acetyltransferase n=1 Tax=Actinoplanes nipponensis TaxID=135950 RepID=A0A919MKC1_9ACTN|nr:GNAT family N-acetyltransferase [Actinoplanes nipponensis]GIE47572.1 GNAT family acetyltransferase [Actinoplanes nipponensis]
MAQVIFRRATRADVPAILALLDDDEIARSRAAGPSPGPDDPTAGALTPEAVDAALWAAFEAIDADPRNELIVADAGGAVVGTCQLTFIPSLSRRGAERMTIEAVRVRGDRRGHGIGREMMLWSLARARERGCGLAQLTTDKRRADAHRFYTSLGFAASHEGFKIGL